ncbi:hypothetical protein [Streptodolium elevatio]
MRFTPDSDNWTSAWLTPGHTYPLQLGAFAWSGAESAWAPVVSATAVARPAEPVEPKD